MTHIDRCDVLACTIPPEPPAAHAPTPVVIVELEAGGVRGLGYSYADVAAAILAGDRLLPLVEGEDPAALPRLHARLAQAVAAVGAGGLATRALSAVDAALWDLRARLLGVPLCDLLGRARERVALCGRAGGPGADETARALGELAALGFGRLELAAGRRPEEDPARVRAARRAIGARVALGVDAEGRYARKQALALAEQFADAGVSWLAEPLAPADLDGLRLLCDRAPAGLAIAAGLTADEPAAARRLIDAGALDVLEADPTRCGGYTGFLRLAALCEAAGLPLVAHGAPALSLPVALAAAPLEHLVWPSEQARIEALLFDGVPRPDGGWLYPDHARSGHGLTLKPAGAQPYLIEAVAR